MKNIYFGPFAEQMRTLINGPYYYIFSCAFSFAVLCLMAVICYYVFTMRAEKDLTAPSRWKYRRDPVLWLGAIALFFLMSPLIYMDQLDPDESLLITSAINLLHDPRPWISADGTTLGPVSYGLLTLVAFCGKLLGGFDKITFFSTHLVVIFCIIIVFINIYKIARQFISVPLTNLVSLFFIFFYFNNFTVWTDIAAYNAEYPFMLLFSVILLIMFRFRNRAGIPAFCLAGFLIGLLPYVKLQTVPFIPVTLLWMFYALYCAAKQSVLIRQHWLKLSGVMIGAISLPTLLLVFYCLTYGGFERAYGSYIENAIGHIDPLNWNGLVWTASITALHDYYFNVTMVAFLVIGCLGLLVIVSDLILDRKSFGEVHIDYIFSLIMFITSIYVLLRSYRGFDHYRLFPLIPVFLVLIMFIRLISRCFVGKIFNIKYADYPFIHYFLAFLLIFYMNLYSGMQFNLAVLKNRQIGASNWFIEPSHDILKLTSPDDSILVWGWEMRLHAYSQRRAATAQPNTERVWGRRYPRHNIPYFIEDIKRNAPKLIIDVVAPVSFVIIDRENCAIDKHPIIWKLVEENYNLIKTIPVDNGTFRIFERKNAQIDFDASRYADYETVPMNCRWVWNP